MPFSRSRYVIVCQQSLVTAAVFAVGISAAGVKTLDIVPQPAPVPGAQGFAQGSLGSSRAGDLGGHTLPSALTAEPKPTEVESAPVTPKVREVKVTSRAARPQAQPWSTQRRATPSQRRVAGKPLVALSAPQAVTGYATVGVTWKPGVSYTEKQVGFQVRTQKAGSWSRWSKVDYHDEHGPDGDAGELTTRARPGTDALVIGDVDRVQLRAENASGQPIPDLQLAVIDPGTGRMVRSEPAIDTARLTTPTGSTGTNGSSKHQGRPLAPQPHAAAAQLSAVETATPAAMKVSPQPYIYSRAQWGANEHIREAGLPNYGTIKAGFIHHTVNANNYTADQVPALLRGIYAYHVLSRGWRDIGYNFLVDRFGRIWEGRYGGITKAVVGAHTLGYNEVSFAMSAIGNYDITQPPQAVLNAYARLFAWKLSMYGIRATATHIWLKDRYVNAINGHRDVGQTACPGRYLYAKIPYIRLLAQRIQDAAGSGTTPTLPPSGTPTPTPTPTTPPTPSSTFTSPTQLPVTWNSQTPRITFPATTSLAGSSYPDLLLKKSDGTIRVLPTGGQLGFGAPIGTAGRWTANLVAAVGDLDGDGHGDVLARTPDGVTRLYRGDGTGHFATTGVDPTLRFRDAREIVAAGDWNRDGRADVLMRDTHMRLWLLRGLGNGRFVRGVLLNGAFGGWNSFAVAGDLTGDGRADLVGIHHTGVLYLLPHTSSGLATPRPLRHVGTLYDRVLGGARDLTGDSIGDVVVQNSHTGSVAVIAGAGGGRLGSTYGWFTGTKGLRDLSAGSVAGSAQADLVGLSQDGSQLVTLVDNGRSNVSSVLPGNLMRPAATQVLSVGDWNRDGRGDVITREGSGDVLVLHRGLGDGRFVRPITMGRGWRSITSLSAVGDVTGDKKPDLAGRTASGRMTIFPGNGASGFLSPRTAPASMKTFNQIGSGSWQPAASGSGWVSSDGSFVPFAGTSGGNPVGYDWIIGPGDVDGDGHPDLVGRDSHGTLWLLPGDGTSLGARRFLASGFGGYTLGG